MIKRYDLELFECVIRDALDYMLCTSLPEFARDMDITEPAELVYDLSYALRVVKRILDEKEQA